MAKLNMLFGFVFLLTAGHLQAQSLTKEQYEAFELDKASSISCPLESGGRMHFYSQDRGNTFELAFSKNANKPRVIVKEAICRPISKRWDLSCTNRNGERLFYVDVTGVHISRKASEGYDHRIAFTASRILKANARENLDSFTSERATLSKCKVSAL